MDPISAGLRPVSNEDIKSETQARQAQDAKIKQACQDFEAIFLTQMVKQMRKSVPKDEKDDSLFSGKEDETYHEMLDSEYAKVMASNNGGIGIAKIMYSQLKSLNQLNQEKK